MVARKFSRRKLKPEWLEKFCSRTFFEPCPEHPIRRNELNKYCIECDASLCQYCVSLASHANHRLLKIYRHVYKDVVPLDEIERHIDISQIQPYRCNRQMVIALTPLPHSGTKSTEEATCLTCKRKLIEHEIYSYCSISCKNPKLLIAQ
ncbi:Tripartite motif-containing protein 2 [Bienertia sinuspersici]